MGWFQLTLPDLQGPFDITELLWGPDAFMAFYSEPDLLVALLEKITATILVAYRRFNEEVKENIGPGFQYQHGTAVRGKVLLRSDTTIMISPEHHFIGPTPSLSERLNPRTDPFAYVSASLQRCLTGTSNG